MGQNAPDILLTNDDGIDAPGLRAVHDRLDEIGTVTTIAPSTDNSGVGRALSMGRSDPLTFGDDAEPIEFEPPEYSWRVPFRPHGLGYEVAGTPADCVIAAVSALDIDPDIVVSGCNSGPNVGMGVLGRSGTVSAVIEASHLGVPGIAVSSTDIDGRTDFAVEADFTSQLVRFSLDVDLFAEIDYLNALVPASTPGRVVVTNPSESNNIGVDIDTDENRFEFHHALFKQLRNGHEIQDEVDTDRHAVERNDASISPLTIRNGPVESDLLETFAQQYEPEVS